MKESSGKKQAEMHKQSIIKTILKAMENEWGKIFCSFSFAFIDKKF